MEREAAEELALKLMRKWKCDGWQFRWSRGVRQLGAAVERRSGATGAVKLRELRLSLHLVDLNDEDTVRDVILHEIAHIKAGIKHGHNQVWRDWCGKVGARPERCSRKGEVNLPPAKLQIVCPQCKSATPRHRRPSASVLKRMYCRECGRSTLGKMKVVT